MMLTSPLLAWAIRSPAAGSRMAEDRTRLEIEWLYGARLDLGSGQFFEWKFLFGDPTERVVSAFRGHPSAKDGSPCCSICWFDVPASALLAPDPSRQLHSVVSWQPLELSPSLRCRVCGSHGRICNGRWEPL
jgi:hypothetical protein